MPMNAVEDISRGGGRRAEGRQAIVFSDEHYKENVQTPVMRP